jgi:hypothetical protein
MDRLVIKGRQNGKLQTQNKYDDFQPQLFERQFETGLLYYCVHLFYSVIHLVHSYSEHFYVPHYLINPS